MPRPRKNSPAKGVSFLEKDRYTAELTSGQLVFGISILLVFGLTCFLLGILVGRFEPAQLQQVAAAPTEEQPANAVDASHSAASPPERAAVARRTVNVEPPSKQAAGVREDKPRRAKNDGASARDDATEQLAKATPAEGPKDLTGPRRVEYPDPEHEAAVKTEPVPAAAKGAPDEEQPQAQPAAETEPEKQTPRAVIIETPAQPAAGQSAAGQSATEKAATEKPTAPKTSAPKAPAEPVHEAPVGEKPNAERMQVASAGLPDRPTGPLEAVEPREAAAKPVAKPAATTTPTPSGAFSIQVAAMSKSTNAEALRKRFAEDLSYPVRVESNPARGLNIVLVGAFQDRNEAQSALRDFRAKYPNFADAFVRAEK